MKYRAGEAEIKRYVKEGWWEESKGLADFVEENAQRNPSGVAYQNGEDQISWEQYYQSARYLAQLIRRESGLGDRVLVWLPDNADVHVCYLACEIAGVVAVGAGWKAGLQELKYLSDVTGASLLLSKLNNLLGTVDDISERLGIDYVSVEGEFNELDASSFETSRNAIGPSDLWFLNSTSGTTGLPKCVMQTLNRWFYFHKKPLISGTSTKTRFDERSSGPLWLWVVDSAYHPNTLRVPCLLQERFDAQEAAKQIEKHQGDCTLCSLVTICHDS